MIIRFEEVKLRGERRVRNAKGKSVLRRKTFMQTLNPYNKNEDGSVKSRGQIYQELRREILEWKAEQGEGGVMVKANRYILEGEWSGYKSSQQRVVHREVLKPYQARVIEKLTTIGFTDGTRLNITVRPCKYREKVKAILGYKEILDRARFQKKEGFVSVLDL